MYSDPAGESITIATLILIGSAIIGAGCAGYTAYKEYEAGFSTVRIIGDSICAGFFGFSIAYSGGMSLYQCYQNYCYLNGLTPVTEISFRNTTQVSTSTVPKEANETLAYVDQNGRAAQGYKGGKEFLNDGRNNSQVLPTSGMPYHEYDIYPHINGTPRGLERIVIGADNSAWYTGDHYRTFIRMR